MAINCRLVPVSIEGLAGETKIDNNTGGVTVRVVESVQPPNDAVIVDVPTATAVVSPNEPSSLLIVTTPGLIEFQVTEVVMSCVVPSENVPVAVNCCVVPFAIEELFGVTSIDAIVAVVTLRSEEQDLLPYDAIIVVVPAVANAEASPFVADVLLIVATPVLDELQ